MSFTDKINTVKKKIDLTSFWNYQTKQISETTFSHARSVTCRKVTLWNLLKHAPTKLYCTMKCWHFFFFQFKERSQYLFSFNFVPLNNVISQLQQVKSQVFHFIKLNLFCGVCLVSYRPVVHRNRSTKHSYIHVVSVLRTWRQFYVFECGGCLFSVDILYITCAFPSGLYYTIVMPNNTSLLSCNFGEV